MSLPEDGVADWPFGACVSCLPGFFAMAVMPAWGRSTLQSESPPLVGDEFHVMGDVTGGARQ
jgi:hypothetical protein